MSQIDQLAILGRQVRRLRSARGLSQEVLSVRCGIFRTYLSRIEGGKANPSATVLMELAARLDVSMCDLFSQSAKGVLVIGRATLSGARGSSLTMEYE
jgi:transcriptional regulator with XRE-family HTH domain